MGFQYVYIPQDPNQPMEERTYEGEVELGNDQFIESLKTHFQNATKQESDVDMLRQQMAQHAGKDAMSKVSDDMMLAMAQMQTVDIFPVMLPLKETEFEGISVYVDDKGVSKGLQMNPRVTSLVQTAGYPDSRFFGDAFIAKIFDDQDDWRRLSITMSEISSEAAWVKKVQAQRKNKSSNNGMADFQKMMAAQQAGAGGPQIVGMPNSGAGGPALGQQQPLPVITEEGNSGDTEVYEWREENKEEMEIAFKEEVSDKKKVKVTFGVRKLTVKYGDKELFSGALKDAVETDESTWSIVDKTKLVVTLMKREAKLWSGVLADA